MKNDIVTSMIISDLRVYNRCKSKLYFILCKPEIFNKVFNLIKLKTEYVIIIKSFCTNLNNISLCNKNNEVKKVYINSTDELDLIREERFSTICRIEDKYFLGFLVEYGAKQCHYKSTPMEIMLRCLASAKLAIFGFLHNSDKFYPIFTDTRKCKLTTLKKKVLVTVWGGYGDAINLIGYLQKFIDRELSKGCTVHVVAGDIRIYRILSSMLRNCQMRLIDLFCMNKERNDDFRGKTLLNQLLADLGYYKDIYNLNVDYSHFRHHYHHIVELWTRVLNIPTYEGYEISYFKMPHLDNSLSNFINDSKSGGKKIVGIQFDSSTPELRVWPKENVQKFIQLCKKQNIVVVNLAPYPYINQFDICDVSSVDILSLLTCISLLDAVVGIDSVCGHMAAVLGVPNISIWNRSTPVAQYKMKVSFRPIRMNYSLVHVSNDISRIMPEIVFKRLEQILDKKIELKQEYITIDDTINNIGVEYID